MGENGIDVIVLAVIVPIVTGLVQAIKKGFLRPSTGKKFAGALAVVAGILVVFVWTLYKGSELPTGRLIGFIILHGIIAGLASAGLYDLGARAVKGK